MPLPLNRALTALRTTATDSYARGPQTAALGQGPVAAAGPCWQLTKARKLLRKGATDASRGDTFAWL